MSEEFKEYLKTLSLEELIKFFNEQAKEINEMPINKLKKIIYYVQFLIRSDQEFKEYLKSLSLEELIKVFNEGKKEINKMPISKLRKIIYYIHINK